MAEPDAPEPKLVAQPADSILSLFKFDNSTVALIVVNFLPVLGGLFLGWDIRGVLLVYWAENLVIGFYNAVKMAKIKGEEGPSKFFLIPFFAFHFGGFCAAHGFFIVMFLASGFAGEELGNGFELMDGAFDSPPPFIFFTMFVNISHFIWETFGFSFVIPVLGLFVSHGISFKQNFLDKKEYENTTLAQQMFKPYGRIVILHVSIIFAALPVFLLGSPMPLLILLVVLKTIVDLFFHLVSHNGGLLKILAQRSPRIQELVSQLENRSKELRNRNTTDDQQN